MIRQLSKESRISKESRMTLFNKLRKSAMYVGLMAVMGLLPGGEVGEACSQNCECATYWTTSASAPFTIYKITTAAPDNSCCTYWLASTGAGMPHMPPVNRDYVQVTCVNPTGCAAGTFFGMVTSCPNETVVGSTQTRQCPNGCIVP
jgi:hypothetical protein